MLCFPHERGRAGALLRAPLWPSLGVASCVAAASVAYSLTGLSGRAFPSLRRDARTNGGALVLCSAPRCGRAWASPRVSLLRAFLSL